MAEDGEPRGMAFTEGDGDGEWGSDGEYYAGPAKKRKVGWRHLLAVVAPRKPKRRRCAVTCGGKGAAGASIARICLLTFTSSHPLRRSA